jgi:putative folate metabolism gamma-glutamate ligase
MNIKSYKTHIVTPGESLLKIVTEHVQHIPEKSILVITSKILSVCQNRILSKDAVKDKLALIQQEADLYLEGNYIEKYGVCLTIKNGILIPTAGIDESNSDDHYILYPVNIQAEAERLWQGLKKAYHCHKLGILMTDSHTTPLRRGVTGIALGWCGFQPLYNYIGKPDIYGRLLRCTYTNVLDGLAAAAVFVMGEGDEQTPLALITDIEQIVFQDRAPTEKEVSSVSISLAEDLYAPLIASVNWRKGGV